MKSLYNYILSMLGLLSLLSCEFEPVQLAEPDESSRPLAAYIKNNYDYSILSAALEYTGMSEELNDLQKSYTIFAPNNQAFSEIGITSPQQIRSLNRDSLRDVLQYHILPQKLAPEFDIPDAALGHRFETLNGDSVDIAKRDMPWVVNNSKAISYVNGANMTIQNIPVANGVLHSINKVLRYEKKTIQQFLEDSPQFTILVAALKKFGYWEQLTAPGAHTVLAPSNSAFAKSKITMADIQALDPSQYYPRFLEMYLMPLDFYIRDFEYQSPKPAIGEYWGSSLLFPLPSEPELTFGLSANTYRTITAKLFIIKPSEVRPAVNWPYGHLFGLRQDIVLYNEYPVMGPGSLLDIVCTNGKVHTLNSILVTLEQARKR